eukprot:PLAT3867.4.p1 GENE.PLAT3867.4~~PLAT3867.4.p1  ORF type:complete len:310 (+),score=126.11 PLAT3867.4:129-932(+)
MQELVATSADLNLSSPADVCTELPDVPMPSAAELAASTASDSEDEGPPPQKRRKLAGSTSKASSAGESAAAAGAAVETAAAAAAAAAASAVSDAGGSEESKKGEGEAEESKDGERVLPDVPSNARLVALIRLLKARVLESIEMLATLKVWIQLLIPRIEDGNNFGVGVQEETVQELSSVEEGGFRILENMTKYFASRARLVSKYLKYPMVHDYRQAVLECDQMQWISLRLCALDTRNNFATMYDMLLKNVDKIKAPRGRGRGMVGMY